jgi:hypothetical protein
MRRPLALLLFTLFALPSPVRGDPAADPKKPKAIDVKPVLGKLLAWRDEVGNYYVTPAPDSFSELDEAGTWVFYGDGKTMYQQRIFGSGAEPGGLTNFFMWSPRAKRNGAAIEVHAGKLTVECTQEAKDNRVLNELKADEAKTFFAKATFLPPLWQRQAHFLARDDDATYYYVDQVRDELGGNGYRVYVGMKGAMKEMSMINIASDSAGEIFATKSGQLKIVAGSDGKAYWIKGGKKVELTVLEPSDNHYLIYRELGLYGKLGAVCEDR